MKKLDIKILSPSKDKYDFYFSYELGNAPQHK